VTILKEVDASSPKLWSALVSNETLMEWTLRFWTPAPAGAGEERQIYTVQLTNANIASMREYMQDNDDPNGAKMPLLEQISFTYQKIEWTWTEGGITATDDWDTP
jgi:type VI secretion system secreted protein Hcp